MHRLFIVVASTALISGCASASDDDMVCPGSDLIFGERRQVEAYLVPDRMHTSIAVAVPCPGDVMVLEAKMPTTDARRAFWTRLNSFEPSNGVIPTARATVTAEIRRSPDGGFSVFEIHEVTEMKAAFPPPQIAATLRLDSAEIRP